LIFLRFWKPKKIWRFDYDDKPIVLPHHLDDRAITDDVGGEWSGPGVRWGGESAKLHCRTDSEGVDTVRDPLTLRAALGVAFDKASYEPATTPAFQSHAAQRQGAARSAGVGCALLAQRHFSRRSVVAKPTPEAARYDFNWLSATGTACFFAAIVSGLLLGQGPAATDEDFLENAGAHAPRDGCDLIHAGPRIRDALLRPGCGAGPGIHAHGMVVSILRHFPGLAGSGADRQRHFVERALRQLAENYFATTRHRSDL
jgi:hypothetical protein